MQRARDIILRQRPGAFVPRGTLRESEEIEPKDYLDRVVMPTFRYEVHVDLPTPEDGYANFVGVTLGPPIGTGIGDEVDLDADNWFVRFKETLGREWKQFIPVSDYPFIYAVVYLGEQG